MMRINSWRNKKRRAGSIAAGGARGGGARPSSSPKPISHHAILPDMDDWRILINNYLEAINASFLQLQYFWTCSCVLVTFSMPLTETSEPPKS